mmetsp:Transcript_21241/g.41362  ORF Transcript_21241/g.41362 Transcript_21241/m.41362 type:complete len:245 (-) Transcript_21241:51-785(-)
MVRQKPILLALGEAVSALGERRGGLGAAWNIVREHRLQPALGGIATVLALLVLLFWRLVWWAELEALHWNLLLSCIALFFNIFLCSFQFIILMNLHDFSQDHVNHFDVEVSIKRMVVPERVLQMIITLVHVWNGAWLHLMLQAPITGWHAFCVAKGVVPVKAVIGRNEEFEKDMRRVRLEHYAKALFYGGTMVLLVFRVCPLAVQSIMGAKLFQVYLGRIFGQGRSHLERVAEQVHKNYDNRRG